MKLLLPANASVALLLDHENIGSNADINLALAFAKIHGDLTVCQAYRQHWQSIKSSVKTWLKSLGFYLCTSSIEGKNSVDIEIMIDCVEKSLKPNFPQTIVLVTGDGDYQFLIELLRRRKRRVIVLARRGSASRKLQQSKHEFYFFDQLPDLLQDGGHCA